jgi:hypothetical protein
VTQSDLIADPFGITDPQLPADTSGTGVEGPPPMAELHGQRRSQPTVHVLHRANPIAMASRSACLTSSTSGPHR